MPNIGARVSDELYDRIAAFTEADEERTQSDAIRALLERGLNRHEREHELEEQINELETEYEERIEELKTERDNLRRQLQATNRRVDEHSELVEYVEEQRELAHRREQYEERRERREERRAHAGVLTRAKWWLVGMPEDEVDQSNASNDNEYRPSE